MEAWRYKYRNIGQEEWHVMAVGFASYAVAEALIRSWSNRDKGVREWELSPCLPEDSDYPKAPERSLLLMPRN